EHALAIATDVIVALPWMVAPVVDQIVQFTSNLIEIGHPLENSVPQCGGIHHVRCPSAIRASRHVIGASSMLLASLIPPDLFLRKLKPSIVTASRVWRAHGLQGVERWSKNVLSSE